MNKKKLLQICLPFVAGGPLIGIGLKLTTQLGTTFHLPFIPNILDCATLLVVGIGLTIHGYLSLYGYWKLLKKIEENGSNEV